MLNADSIFLRFNVMKRIINVDIIGNLNLNLCMESVKLDWIFFYVGCQNLIRFGIYKQFRPFDGCNQFISSADILQYTSNILQIAYANPFNWSQAVCSILWSCSKFISEDNHLENKIYLRKKLGNSWCTIIYYNEKILYTITRIILYNVLWW